MNEREKLIELIAAHEGIKRYKEIEESIHNNPILKQKFADLKHIQKQLINAKKIGKMTIIDDFEKQYQACLMDIEDYPLMSEYLLLQSEINAMLQYVLEVIENGLNDDLTQQFN